MKKEDCPFCTLPRFRIVRETDFSLLIRDGYPVSEGHSLIIPKRHIRSFFETTEEERKDLNALLDIAKQELDTLYHPDAYNIGINDGLAAGQTIIHMHIHLIPRYQGDVDDPRGGIRWIIPEKAAYWK